MDIPHTVTREPQFDSPIETPFGIAHVEIIIYSYRDIHSELKIGDKVVGITRMTVHRDSTDGSPYAYFYHLLLEEPYRNRSTPGAFKPYNIAEKWLEQLEKKLTTMGIRAIEAVFHKESTLKFLEKHGYRANDSTFPSLQAYLDFRKKHPCVGGKLKMRKEI